jgi:hypothetical protein
MSIAFAQILQFHPCNRMYGKAHTRASVKNFDELYSSSILSEGKFFSGKGIQKVSRPDLLRLAKS